MMNVNPVAAHSQRRSARCCWSLLLLLMCGPPQALPREPCNVLFIAVDDMRVELGCYGETQALSPNIDRLAADGTLFERAYCQQAVCNPSRASLLTGLRPDRLRVWDLPTHFRANLPEAVTLPQWFMQQGYQSIDIGKIFHNWRQDAYRGDPESWSEPALMHYASHATDEPWIEDQEVPQNLSHTPRTEMRDVADNAYFDGRIADLAVARLKAWKAAVEKQAEPKPLFLAVGFWKPHAPFNAPKAYWDLYDRSAIELPKNPEPPRNVPSLAMHDSREILRGFVGKQSSDLSDAEVRALRHGYFAAISYVDAQIGKVVQALDALELREKTVVVLWSDHGFHLGEHGLWAKTSNFELDARVPLIISAPGMPKAQRVQSVVELLDLYPTLVELCDLPMPQGLQGRSLLPVLRDASLPTKGYALTQHTRPAYPTDSQPVSAMGYSLRTDRYRYTEWRGPESGLVLARELYDHRLDPLETLNRALDVDAKEILQHMSEQLAQLIDAPPDGDAWYR